MNGGAMKGLFSSNMRTGRICRGSRHGQTSFKNWCLVYLATQNPNGNLAETLKPDEMKQSLTWLQDSPRSPISAVQVDSL